ncbi:MAG: hypothetical protein CVU97_00085 [Firmicutes bacterium HGW-Firmicutes-21]|nr:MAG: hypothetical protein CVU97_00085 [Firmicutes bacterium HGW-Firmicutes-21]
MQTKKPQVFMIFPFDEDFLALYSDLKIRFSDSFVFSNADDLDNQQNILKDIVVGINSADIIIADLTGLNPNVFYELGLAHALNKKVIIITQDISELPFDIRSYKANEYGVQFYKITKLFDKLENLLNGAIDGSIQFGNPISDFILSFNDNTTKDVTKEMLSEHDVLKDHEDKGFLDYIADIDESMSAITSVLYKMQTDMEKMSSSINQGSQEISKMKNSGGSATAIFVRNISRKLAEPVDTFANQMKNHNKNIADKWTTVENDYLNLLDNRFIKTEDNIQGLIESKPALESIRSAINESNEKMEGFKDSIQNCMGMERRLTKAFNSLLNEIENYITITDTISSSIERILSKTDTVIKSFNK